MAEQAEVWSFPTNLAEFDSDDRISFSKLDNKYIAVQSDGTEYEFDADLKRWLPIIDEALIQAQQQGYGFAADDDDDLPADPLNHGQKRKKGPNDREDSAGRSKSNKRQAVRQPPQPKQNTAIYVTGLPLDVTVDEVAEHFSRKCGVIAEEIDSGRPRIKLYTDSEGNFKGDALIVFFKPQSVEMAIMLLDDTDFRFTSSGLSSGKIRVQAADSSYKKTNQDSEEGGKSNNGEGAGNGQDKKSHRQRNEDKVKIIKKTQKLSAKLADWDDDEPAYVESKGGKWDKVVILSHMFTLEELEEDPAALLDIKDDIREECAKIGEVTNVVLFDLEQEGIVSVKFRTPEAAKLCVDRMHGRAFDGRTVEAFFATGKEKFQRSSKDGNGENNEDDDD